MRIGTFNLNNLFGRFNFHGVGLLDELAAGAAGAMTGFSHPEGLWAAPWLPLANFEGQAGIGLAVRKEILRRRGVLTTAAVRPPVASFPTALAMTLDAHLRLVPTEVGV